MRDFLYKWAIVLILVMICFVVFLCMWAMGTIHPRPLKSGQVWFEVVNDHNPFLENDTTFYEVLEIRGKYVKYKTTTDDKVRYMSKNLFKHGLSYRKKNPEDLFDDRFKKNK